ncbi:MAG: hypothetical protein RR313_08005 [Anaerovoracaceae bacterium]
MDKKYFDTIQEFKTTSPASILIKHALKKILPTRSNYFGFVLSIGLSILFSLILGVSLETVTLAAKFANIFLGIQLAVFGCIFAVYSILLAFLSDGYMRRLAKSRGEHGASLLKECTTYYESVLFLYFINIGVTGVVLLFCECIDPAFRLTQYIYLDTAIAVVLLLLYFSFSFRVFYELKSTIYNTIILFRASIAYKFIDFSVEDEDGVEK